MQDLQKIIEFSKTLTLLYVEDNESAREATLIIFKEFFDTIILANDGQEGLQKFISNHIDIVITDINMPKMSGLEMSREIRNFSYDIPIVILSAHNEKDIYEEAEDLNIEKYLFKPIEFTELIEALKVSINKIKDS